MAAQVKQVVMRPLDVVILLKKLTVAGAPMNGKQLAESLSISPAEVSVALERNRISGLVDEGKTRVNVLALKDFLVYGIRYSFPVQPSGLVRGVPTASSASPINQIVSSNGEKYVWPDSRGTERGQAVTPLYNNATIAIKKDVDFYALLAIVDSLRIGKSRERAAAVEELDKYLVQYAKPKQQ